MFVLAGAVAAFEEQELGAHQTDAFATLRQRIGHLIGAVHIGGDRDAMAVAGDGGAAALGFLGGAARGDGGDPVARGGQVGLGRIEPDAAGIAIDDRDRPRRLRQQIRARRDDGGQAECAREDGAV